MNNHTKQQTYEYSLPIDNHRLMVDSITLGTFHAIKDGMNSDDAKEKAIQVLAWVEKHVTCDLLTNDTEAFNYIFIESYANAYNEKQERYKKNPTLHKKEAKTILEWGEKAYTNIRAHMEMCALSVEGGNT